MRHHVCQYFSRARRQLFLFCFFLCLCRNCASERHAIAVHGAGEVMLSTQQRGLSRMWHHQQPPPFPGRPTRHLSIDTYPSNDPWCCSTLKMSEKCHQRIERKMNETNKNIVNRRCALAGAAKLPRSRLSYFYVACSRDTISSCQ